MNRTKRISFDGKMKIVPMDTFESDNYFLIGKTSDDKFVWLLEPHIDDVGEDMLQLYTFSRSTDPSKSKSNTLVGNLLTYDLSTLIRVFYNPTETKLYIDSIKHLLNVQEDSYQRREIIYDLSIMIINNFNK